MSDEEIIDNSELTPEDEFEAERSASQGATPKEEAKPEKERHIPYDRFQEVYAEKQQLQQQIHAMQMNMLQMQQQAMMQQQMQTRPVDPEPEIDTEVEKLIAPIINKQTRVLQNQLAEAQQRLAALQQMGYQTQAETEARNAWAYVESNVPDLEDLRSDLVDYIKSLSPVVQNKITSDPDQVIIVANMVRLQRQMQGKTATNAGKQALKNKAHTAGSGSSQMTSDNNLPDFDAMSMQEFEAWENKNLKRR